MRFLAAVAGLTIAMLFSVAPVDAGDGFSDGDGSGGVVGDAITAGVQFGRPPSAKGRSDSSGCTWTPAAEAQTFEGLVVTTKVVNGVTYELFYRSCPTSGAGIWVPQVSPRTLGLRASDAIRQRLAAPTVGSAPPANQGVVKVGMWLWTDPSVYVPVSITAWVPTPTGIAWATTTATPSRLVFLSGEPGSAAMVCQGPGRQWLPQFGDDVASACMYTYQHSSEVTASDLFDARLSIVWSIRWLSNVANGGGLGEYTTSTDQSVTVNEIQAVITN